MAKNYYDLLLSAYVYKDKVTVKRQIGITDDIGADVYDIVDVYTDVPCRLGQQGTSGMNGGESDRAFSITDHLRLSVSSELEILPSDILTVTTGQGQVYTMRAQEPFKYITHQEVPLIKVGEA